MDQHHHALLTPAEIAQADRIAVSLGDSSFALMEHAGRAVADAACRMLPRPAEILVLCGPGNNGGDGFVAARILRERGHRVTLSLLGSADSLGGDAAVAAGRWAGQMVDFPLQAVGTYELIVDALLGAGLNRPLTGDAQAWVEASNRSGRPILSVDVPSGLSGASGCAEGAVMQARRTITFFRLKPGHLLLPGRELCGVVELAQIGIPAKEVFAQQAPHRFRNDPDLWHASWPRHGLASHKFERGAVAVLAGGLDGVGAPRLAARAAMRIGAGLATILCRPEALSAHASRGPDALMQRPIAGPDDIVAFFHGRRVAAGLAGPALGLDDEAAAMLDQMIEQPLPIVLDADALTLIARQPERVRSLLSRGAATVLTPHEGEFKRLFGKKADIAVEPSKIERARKAAQVSGSIVVYKGADTVIADPDGRAIVNATGNAALATAGAGDVLAGVITGLLAQGMPAFEAASAAVWLHGKAGEDLGIGLIADDLPEAIAEVAKGCIGHEKARPEGRARLTP